MKFLGSWRPVVIVFVRAPVLGGVKRRLAAGIGMVAARRFYVETTREVLRRLCRDPRWDVHLAVTPDDAVLRGRYWARVIPRFAQRGGDLGHRMARAMRRFPNRPVLLVGSDVPEIDVRHIEGAFRALGRCDLVFGPASDGGYWLVGAREAGMVRGLFRDVRWSGPQALADTVANAGGRRVTLLDVLGDVDDSDDYERWRHRSKQES